MMIKVDLRIADGIGGRAARRVLNRHFSAALRSRGRGSWWSDDLWVDFEMSLRHAMACAYDAGMNGFPVRIEMSGDKEVRKVMRSLPKRQKDAVNELYGKVASSATKSTRARVRDRMVKGVRDFAKGDQKGFSKRLGALVKQQTGVAQTIVRTQNAIAFNAALWHQSYDDPEVWGYEYTTAGDERVRPDHEDMDGVRYPKEHPFWRRFFPPNGWRCRCTPNIIYVGEPDATILPFRGGTPDVPSEFRFNPGYLLRGILSA